MIMDWREIAGVPILNEGYQTKKQNQTETDFLLRAKLNTSAVEDMGGFNRWWEWEVYLQTDSLHWTMDKNAGIAWEGRKPGRGGVHDSYQLQQAVSEQPSVDSTVDEVPAWWPMLASDSRRGWVILLAWAVSGVVERPTHILDHTLTLHFFHFLLTSHYSKSIPTNLFYWLAMLAHAGACVVWAEALSIRREMLTGWTSGWQDPEEQHGSQEQGEGEQSALLSTAPAPSINQTIKKVATHVLFEDVEDEEEVPNRERKGSSNGNGHSKQDDIEMKRLN
ncbi:hypothetical protein CBS101457_005933 [Exobasidium rhododendri]|nr:hypothetical protein CBS101457_005933 [Exobasidium rhododendri]